MAIAIPWAPADRPTDAQIAAVLHEVEKTAWAGLEPDRYSWTAVVHRRARRRYPPARPYGPVRPGDGQEPEHRAARLEEDVRRDCCKAFNHDHGWSRPDDPGAGEDAATGPSLLQQGGRVAGRPGARGRPRSELVRDYLVQRVGHGVVRSRAGVVAALEDAGFEVPR